MPAEEEVHEVCDVEHKSVIDTDIKLYNINSEDLQPISESSEEAQIETTVEPNVPDSPSSAACFDSEGNSVNEKSSIQPIVAGAALLVSSIVAYILKMYAIAVIGGIIGLACVSHALYNALKPGTKLEKVENVEQPIFFESNICSKNVKQISNKLISLEESISY